MYIFIFFFYYYFSKKNCVCLSCFQCLFILAKTKALSPSRCWCQCRHCWRWTGDVPACVPGERGSGLQRPGRCRDWPVLPEDHRAAAEPRPGPELLCGRGRGALPDGHQPPVLRPAFPSGDAADRLQGQLDLRLSRRLLLDGLRYVLPAAQDGPPAVARPEPRLWGSRESWSVAWLGKDGPGATLSAPKTRASRPRSGPSSVRPGSGRSSQPRVSPRSQSAVSAVSLSGVHKRPSSALAPRTES